MGDHMQGMNLHIIWLSLPVTESNNTQYNNDKKINKIIGPIQRGG